MKSIKKIILHTTFIFITIQYNQIHTKPMGTEAVKALDETLTKHTPTLLEASAKIGLYGATELGEKLAQALQNIDPYLGHQAASALGDKVVQALQHIDPALGNQAAATFGDKLAQALQHVDPSLGHQAASALGDKVAQAFQHIDPTLGNQAAATLGDKLKEAAPLIGREAAEKWAPALETASTAIGVGVAIYGVCQVTSMATDVYKHFNPDEEKKARINAARETNEYFDAKRGLRHCLMNKANTPRNPEGRPTTCENFAQAYLVVAGQAALDEMTKNFKNAYKE